MNNEIEYYLESIDQISASRFNVKQPTKNSKYVYNKCVEAARKVDNVEFDNKSFKKYLRNTFLSDSTSNGITFPQNDMDFAMFDSGELRGLIICMIGKKRNYAEEDLFIKLNNIATQYGYRIEKVDNGFYHCQYNLIHSYDV